MADFQELKKIHFLKPCPFCGGEAAIHACGEIANDELSIIFGTKVGVHCMGCHVATLPYDSEAEAVEVWNRRAEPVFATGLTTATDAPPVEYAPVKHGRWVITKASIHPYGNDVKCSNCGHKQGSSFGYKYCPICGAKMDLEVDNGND